MSNMFHILFVLSSQDVKKWAEDVLRAAQEDANASLYDIEQIREAAETPQILLRGTELREQLEQLYRNVVARDPDLYARYQQFSALLAGSASPLSLYQGAARTHLSPPCDFWLSVTYPDIEVSAERIEAKLVQVQAKVNRPHAALLLDSLKADLAEIRDGKYEASHARLELQRIENAVDGTMGLLALTFEQFRQQAIGLFHKLSIMSPRIENDAQQAVEGLHVLIGDALLDQGVKEEDFRAAAVEAYLLLSSIPESTRTSERPPAASKPVVQKRVAWHVGAAWHRPLPIGMPRHPMSDAAEMAWRMISNGQIDAVVPDVSALLKGNHLAAGAAILSACFQHRWPEERMRPITPLIRRAFMRHAGGIAQKIERDPPVSTAITRILERGIALVLDLSVGALEPYGVKLARENRDLIVVSIDPTPVQRDGETANQCPTWPSNFTRFTAWAWELCPIAISRGPFARKAVIVSPSHDGWMQPVLSALLAMEPSGHTDIIGGPDTIFQQLAPLIEAGFSVTRRQLPAAASNSETVAGQALTRISVPKEVPHSPGRDRRGGSHRPGSSMQGNGSPGKVKPEGRPAARVDIVTTIDMAAENDNGFAINPEETAMLDESLLELAAPALVQPAVLKPC